MAWLSLQTWLLFFLYKSACVVHRSAWCFLLSLAALLKTNYFYKRAILKSNTLVFYFLNINQIPVICGLSSASPKILICDCTFAKWSEVIKNFIQYFLNYKHCISPLNWLKYRPLYKRRRLSYVTWLWENQRIYSWEELLLLLFLIGNNFHFLLDLIKAIDIHCKISKTKHYRRL